jgi:RNA polymerase sigma-70 factor (ECF subfamily)
MTQQVFLKSLQSIHSFKWKGANFSSWLFRIAHNLIVDYYRKKSRAVTTNIDNIQIAAKDDPQETTERNVDIEQLASATKNLTKAQQEVISLRFAGELSIKEAAKAMGKKENAIKALQHSAILALRKSLLAENG